MNDMLWVGDFIRHYAEIQGDSAAIIVPETGVSITYAELDRRIGRTIAVLAQQGIKRGDRIAYYGRNSDLYFPVLFATIRAGIVLVPLNWRCAEPEIAFFLTDSEAKLVIGDADFLEIAAKVSSADLLKTDDLRGLIEADGPVVHDAIAWDDETACLMLYTSGTTGRPKGVMITHRALSIARNKEISWEEFPNWRGETIVSAMPNFHIGGMSWMLMGLHRGSTCILTADPSGTNITKLLRTYQAQHTFIVPTVVRAVVDEVKASGMPLPALKTILYGAAPMSRSLLEDAIETLGCAFAQFFGMTETTGSVSFLLPKEHDPERPELLGSVGRAYPDMEIEIRDANARILPVGVAGEIWIKTPTAMQGYWNRPDATADVLQGGWYRSGDGGKLDSQGFLYLTDRIKDMIVSGGENVYPGEVEEVLRRFPSVLDAAVVGLPDERWGESVAALVEARAGEAVDPDALIAFARTQLAAFKCPKQIVISVLPRTASGKVQRAAARAMMMENKA